MERVVWAKTITHIVYQRFNLENQDNYMNIRIDQALFLDRYERSQGEWDLRPQNQLTRTCKWHRVQIIISIWNVSFHLSQRLDTYQCLISIILFIYFVFLFRFFKCAWRICRQLYFIVCLIFDRMLFIETASYTYLHRDMHIYVCSE